MNHGLVRCEATGRPGAGLRATDGNVPEKTIGKRYEKNEPREAARLHQPNDLSGDM
jgi:hypothetical protein